MNHTHFTWWQWALIGSVLPFNVQASLVSQSDIKLEYQSAFKDYRYFSDQALQNWYQLNQTVEQIGGWRHYQQEPYKSPLSQGSKRLDQSDHQSHHNHHGGGK